MKILSFGEIIWDVYGNDAQIGGAPLNFAAHTARRGTEAYMLSAVGKDDLGERALRELNRFNVKSDYVTKSDKETGKCLVTLDQNGVPSYNIIKNVAYESILLPESLKNERFSAFAFGSLALSSEQNRKTVAALLEMGVCEKIYCDLNLRAPLYTEETVSFCINKANILKLSEEELYYVENLLNIKSDDIENSCKAICKVLGNLEVLIVTLGENGSCVYSKADGKYIRMDSKKVEVVSTVGAGDSFGAAFLTEYLQGKDLRSCLEAATELSAYVVAHQAAIPD